MTRKDKLTARFRQRPRDFTWDELVRPLAMLGYSETAAGKTGGSRRRFIQATGSAIILHRPHPGNVVKMYVMDEVRRILEEEKLL